MVVLGGYVLLLSWLLLGWVLGVMTVIAIVYMTGPADPWM